MSFPSFPISTSQFLTQQCTLSIPYFLLRITFHCKASQCPVSLHKSTRFREEIVGQITRLNTNDDGFRSPTIVKARIELLLAVSASSFPISYQRKRVDNFIATQARHWTRLRGLPTEQEGWYHHCAAQEESASGDWKRGEDRDWESWETLEDLN